MTPSYKSYVICTSPRSGSTLLCKLLSSTGAAGHPKSYFYENALAEWQKRFGLPSRRDQSPNDALRNVLKAAIKEGSGDTGLFGLRMQRHSFAYFMEQLASLYPTAVSDRERLENAFGATLFVYLTRADKADQAVSLLRAEKSGLWHKAPDGKELERLAPTSAPGYDFQELSRTYDLLQRYETEWENWFSSENISPLRITYDQLSANPIGTLNIALEDLGLNTETLKSVEIPTAKLADATSREWVSRFKNDLEKQATSSM